MAPAVPAMSKVALRSIGAHKLRLALTLVAVVLGTAFISGSLMFMNMLERTFDSAVASVYADKDVVVRPLDDAPVVPAQLREDIARDPQVARVNVLGRTPVVVANADRQAFQTGAGASEASIHYPADQVVGDAREITAGSPPAAVGEAVLNEEGAKKFGVSVGDQIIVVGPKGQQSMRVTGLYGSEVDQGASLSVLVSEPAYLQLYSAEATLPGLAVEAGQGVAPEQLVAQLNQKFPGYEIQQGTQLADETSRQIREGLGFISFFLIAFGLVGLLVGTFLIANTFSMIVSQRVKEFALLRALGAAKRQIARSIVVEAFIVGVAGSALGVAAGAGLVALIRGVMRYQGMNLPGAGWGVSASTVLVPIIVGTVVTVLSAWAPARRAGKVQPVEAMRSNESATPQPLKRRTLVGTVLLVAGCACVVRGVTWDDGPTGGRAAFIGLAAIGLIVGLFLAGPALSLPVVPVLGRVVGTPFGAVGSLAATNSQRNPRRASATAFALMLGIALVTVIGMLGATMQRTVGDILKNEVSSDMVLTGPQFGAFPVPADLPDKVSSVAGVKEVVTYSQAPLTVNGEFGYPLGAAGITDVVSTDPARLLNIDVIEGTTDLTGGGVLVPTAMATGLGLQVGDNVTVAALGTATQAVQAPIKGTYEGSSILESWVVSQDTAAVLVPRDLTNVLMVGVDGDGSVDQSTLRANLEAAVKNDIVVQVRTPEEVGGEAQQMINQMLYILYALLSLAVVTAILGIANTLMLSVIERRREIGMLRAVGSQRMQVRTMIILESVQIAVFGALLGVVTGLGLGWAFLTVLADQGLDSIAYPWTLVGIMLGGAVLVGVVAALWPALRAAATPPLDAIAE